MGNDTCPLSYRQDAVERNGNPKVLPPRGARQGGSANALVSDHHEAECLPRENIKSCQYYLIFITRKTSPS